MPPSFFDPDGFKTFSVFSVEGYGIEGCGRKPCRGSTCVELWTLA